MYIYMFKPIIKHAICNTSLENSVCGNTISVDDDVVYIIMTYVCIIMISMDKIRHPPCWLICRALTMKFPYIAPQIAQ